MADEVPVGVHLAGRRITLRLPGYNHALVEESKTLSGSSRWDGVTQSRSYPASAAPLLVAYARKHNLDLDPGVETLANKHADEPVVTLHRAGVRIRRGPWGTPPEEVPQDSTKEWISVGMMSLSAVLSWAHSHSLKVDERLEKIAVSQFLTESQNYALGTALSAPEREITGLVSTPLPEQWVPVEAAVRSRRFLLADEQGLGKTIESLMVSRIAGDESKRLVIVCPDRMTETWINEMNTHFTSGTFTPWIATSRTPKPIPEEVDAVVIGWAVLGHWCDALISWAPDMVIADEGHYAKAGKQVTRKEESITKDAKGNLVKTTVSKKVGGSARSSALIDLFSWVHDDGKAIILTGTPIPNRPQELLAILVTLGIEGYFGGSHLFKMRYCGAKKVFIGQGRGIGGSGYAWDFSGASNLIELNSRLLSSGHYVRRTKEHLVLSERLPEKIVDGVSFYDTTTEPVPTLITGDSAIMREYVEMEYGLSCELADFAIKHAASIGASPTSAKVIAKVAAEGNKNKERLFELRRLAGMAAIPEVTAIAKEYVGAGEKIMIVAHHRDVVDAYEEAIPGAVKIQGAMSSKSVEAAKARFNAAGMDTPAMILAIEAGKTGHTLCKQPDRTCAVALFAEQAWSPSDDHQAQDRIWRIGQNRPVSIRNILVEGTVNEGIYNARRRKRRIVDAAVDSKVIADAQNEREMIGELSIMLTQKRLTEAGN